MRFNDAMVGKRGEVVKLVKQGVLSQQQGADELGVSVRQIRRLVERLDGAADPAAALRYQRRHPAPNRIDEMVRERVGELMREHPHWSAAVIWEALEATGTDPLPSERTVRRWVEMERPVPAARRRDRPARRFEAPRPLCLVQMDTTSGQWLVGKRSAHVIVTLDDYSRVVLAAQAVEADSTVNNLEVLEATVARYGPMEVLYSDNGSVFRITRYARSRFYSYRPEVLAGEEPTQLARAVRELGAVPLTHEPGNARAKGKLERWNRFFQERVIAEGPFPDVEDLDHAVQEWIGFYNERHIHRAIGAPPASRLAGFHPRALPAGARPLEDICALLDTRKVAKDHTISFDGLSYTLPREPNLVAFTVELRIRPGRTLRVWYRDQLIAELAHGIPPAPEGLSVDQLLEAVLARAEPKPPKRSPSTRERR